MNSQTIYCPYCNKSFKSYFFSDNINAVSNCHDCNVEFYYKNDDVFEIIYWNSTSKEELAIDYNSNSMTVTIYGNSNSTHDRIYRFPKALPVSYLISHSIPEIFQKIKSLLSFL